MRTLFLLSSHHMLAWPDGHTDALSVFAGKTGYYALRDRFGFLNRFSPYNLYEPHLNMYEATFSKPLRDVMDERAAELWNKSRREGRDLYLFCSGGVDSTAMTIAMLKNAGGSLRGLHVVYTKYSVEEYPAFFEHLRAAGVAMHFVLPGRALDKAQQQAMEKGYALTGWCADQLFGSLINHNYPDWYFRDWRDWIGFDDAVGQFEEAFRHYGLPVRTLGEFLWFMNFSCKYDFVKYTDVMLTGRLTGRMLSFYDTPEFNAWSVSNFDVLHQYPQQDTEHYKAQLKDYIFAYNGDRAYRLHKGKQASWPMKREGDARELWTYPVCVIAMESPERVRVESAGVELPEDDEKAARLREAMMKRLLSDYQRTDARRQA